MIDPDSDKIDRISSPDMQLISTLLPLYEKEQFDRLKAAVNHGFAGVK
jgi:hypothetical protein